MSISHNNWQDQFTKRFQEASSRCLLRHDACYLVGVSGGADSVALAHWLHEQDFPITIAHFHHGARRSADDDAAYVASFAAALGIPFHQGYQDVPALAADMRQSFEEAARIARYQFLFSLADSLACDGVIVAHTADDQVETVLMHFLRGAGVAGLAGMSFREQMPQWHATIPLLRPFLNQWRKDVEVYCQQYDLTYVEDESNQDQTFFRNRLRHSLVPILTSYNAGVKEHIWQTADILRDSESIITMAVDQAWHQVVAAVEKGLMVLNLDQFLSIAPALQRYLVRACVQRLYPNLRDLDYKMTRSTVDTIASADHDGSWLLFDNCLLMRYGSSLLLGTEEAVYVHWNKRYPQWRHSAAMVDLQENGTIEMGEGWMLSYETILMDEKRQAELPWRHPNPQEAWFDRDELSLPIMIRTPAEGDRIQPFGMHGRHVKLSDYFGNQKIPQMMRQTFPLICDKEDILWLPGQRRSEKGLLSPSTEKIIHIRLEREDG